MAHRHEKEKAVNVQVLLRCRPFSDDELRCNAPQVVTCNDFQREVAVSQTIAGKQIDRVFTFDKVFGPSSQQRDLYEQAIVPIVNEVLEGFNCTIFAYGQTGTGKTYTMEGECKRSKSGTTGDLPPHAGVIPRAVKQIFETLESQNAEYSVKVTFLELYNEEITDLLAPEELSRASLEEKQKKALPLMEDGKGGVLVRGLEEEIVTSSSEIFTLLERGCAKRRTAETLLNKQSSRSHSLFTVTIHIKEATPEGEELIKCGKLNLVDLAGSENISRSGAREGRAREAGEINKSLLTLGRVITALVEHSGHVPYRDSKLTRLLRDSLGGRTKTCIIATVSPAVHCLEETLSTLDYAHRAKNIKNRPEVNQKMMKSTLIKDLYGEIERLKAEVYAAREKVGVYIPKERYYQEESERKAMADQIEQMGVMMETNQKQMDDLQEKYKIQIQHSSDLSKKLEATEKSLEHTSKLLASTKEDLSQSQYSLKEKDFIISKFKTAESELTNQAHVLQAELEKRIKENASLFSKLARENKLNSGNREVVDKFQIDIVEKIGALCRTVVSSTTQQKQLIQNVEGHCRSCLDFHDKSLSTLKEKLLTARIQYVSHLEAIRNNVHLQKANINGSMEEISSLVCASLVSVEQILASGEGIADQIISDLQEKISGQRGEIADFVQDLREIFSKSTQHTKLVSKFVDGVVDILRKESLKLQNHATQTHYFQAKRIVDFQKAFEEQSRLEEEKIVSQMTSLIASHFCRQKDLVVERLSSLRDAASEDKEILDAHISTVENVTNDAKRKWDNFALQAENSSNEGVDFASVKHCRMELLFQSCVASVDAASKHWKDINKFVVETSKEHGTSIDGVARSVIDSNEQHDQETASARIAAEKDISKNSEQNILYFKGISEQEHKLLSEMMETLEDESSLIRELDVAHACQADGIKLHAERTFSHNYKDYEPTGETPVRSEPDLPSKGIIESLRAMPMDALLEDFRENNPYVSTKEPKPSLIPRSPLIPKN